MKILFLRLVAVFTAFFILVPFVSATEYIGKKGEWNGFESYEFDVGNRPCRIAVLKTVADGRPWIWRVVSAGYEYAPKLLWQLFVVVFSALPTRADRWNLFYFLLTR